MPISRTVEYYTWQRILGRCYNQKRPDYHWYGGRGITVCDRWRHSFENFLADLGPRPSPRHSIERRDNEASYSPDNCRWATAAEQANNRRSNTFLVFNGERLTIADWSRRTGIGRSAITWRLGQGWKPERTLTEPTAPTITHNGETLTLRGWADRLGIKKTTLWYRLHQGWPLDRAFSR